MQTAELVPEQRVFAVVILGKFNPAIFHPLWYAHNDLIPREETDEASDVITSDEVSTFVVNAVHFQVERHRFGLTTKDASRAAYLRDLTVGSFTLLEHTPLTALGLNLDFRFSLPDVEAWHEIGHRLAPKEHWNGILESPGMRGITMEGTRSGCNADRISIRVQPASSFEHGVFIGINQHYNIETEKRTSIAERNTEVMRILNSDWNAFQSYAENAALDLVLGRQVEREDTQ